MMTTVGMSKVKLRQNLIFDGIFYQFGTILDRNEVPLSLRKSKYLAAPDEPEAVRIAEDDYVDQEVIFDESMNTPVEGIEIEEEFEEPPPKPKFKPKFRG